MTQYAAFLRAVNVAGHAMLKMSDFKTACATAGCRNPRTFIQSGNVVFDVADRSAPAVFRRLHAELRGLLGAEPTIFFRTIDSLEGLLRADPFQAVSVPRDAKRYVTFLLREPAAQKPLPLGSAKEALDAFAMKDLDVFVVSGRKKNGMYGFPNNFIEAELGVPATTRNWSTITRIVEFARKEAGNAESPGGAR
jgi:uncharacterized protein (DUF1697 family)